MTTKPLLVTLFASTAAVLAGGPLALGLLASGSSAQPAELAGASSTIAVDAAPAAASRTQTPPVLRVVDSLNTPTARRARLYDAYSTCLLDHGARRASAGDGPVADPTFTGSGILVAQPVPAAAEAACADVEPVQPAALDAATNPDFAAEADDYVGCLRDHGLWVRLLNDHDPSWTYEAGHAVPDDENGAMEDACLVAAFGRN